MNGINREILEAQGVVILRVVKNKKALPKEGFLRAQTTMLFLPAMEGHAALHCTNNNALLGACSVNHLTVANINAAMP